MCIYPLSEEKLANLNKYKYKSTNQSLLYNHIASPFLNKLVNFVPTKLAPNVITLSALMFNVIAAVISYLDGGFDFSHELKRTTCLTIGLFQLIYYILDGLDGKQARKTGNSTPFGMIMDHGCDVFTTVLTAFNFSKILLLGNEDFYSFTAFFTLLLGFYMITFEELKVGEMHLPKLSGADEGNIVVVFFGLVFGIIGQSFLKANIIPGIKISTGKFFGLCMAIASLSTVFNCYVNTYKKKGGKECLRNIYQNANFYSVIVVPLIYIFYFKEFYKENKGLILLNASCIFARVCVDLQIKICTMDVPSCCMLYIFSNVTFVFSLFTYFDFIRYWVLLILFIVQGVELSFFVFIRAREISKYLDIKIFCIKEKSVLPV